MGNKQKDDREVFENVIRALEAEIVNVGFHLTVDSQARQVYEKQIRAMASELRIKVSTGKISWIKAAEQAQEARNLMMQIIRSRSTPVGMAMAQRLKSEGKTLNELIAKKTRQLYGNKSDFNSLASTRQNIVYSEIVKSAGKSNPRVTAVMRRLSHTGRGLIVISIALSVYTVATAEKKFNAAGREIAIAGAGVGGGMAGGAVAGLVCGPGAPVCVTVGAFVGGALAAFGISIIW